MWIANLARIASRQTAVRVEIPAAAELAEAELGGGLVVTFHHVDAGDVRAPSQRRKDAGRQTDEEPAVPRALADDLGARALEVRAQAAGPSLEQLLPGGERSRALGQSGS